MCVLFFFSQLFQHVKIFLSPIALMRKFWSIPLIHINYMQALVKIFFSLNKSD
jgi:hypothetical protein